MVFTRLFRTLVAAGLVTAPHLLLAQNVDIEQRQREKAEQIRLQQLQEQEQRAHVIDTTPKEITAPSEPAAQSAGPCFKLTHIEWLPAHSTIAPPLYLKLAAYNAIHARDCFNQAQIIQLQKDLSNSLLDHGHITSKVSLPEQSIASGILKIDWLPGTVENVLHDPKGGAPIGSLYMLFPNRVGVLYNQRQADQALENLKRLSSQGNAKMELQPGSVAGTSNIVYQLEPKTWRQRINGTVGIDNTGSDSTGQYQLNGSVSIDSPLNINDQLTLNLNRNADMNNGEHNTKSFGGYWDIATGYGTFGLGYTKSTYLQTVPGYMSNLAYTGNSQDFYANAGFMLHRSSTSKTLATVKLGRKISHNLIDDTEVPVQMRDYVYSDMGINHTQYHQDQQYTVGFNVRQNLPSLSNAVGFIYGQPDWNGKWRIYSLNASASVPFKLGSSSWKYSGSLKLQRADRPTPGSELFSLGSRYTVRGFDERFSISAEDGILVRNEWAYLYGKDQRQQAYIGLDWGRIKGSATTDAIATSLAGSALGVRGSYMGVSYDAALGIPLKSPTYISHKHRPSLYASLSYQF